ncbi:MAG: formylmethanofuran dehydrogenase subunit A, partial [Gemmataceae bacterium]|nr:formylmethanofuran dehydrogenase subunit A [Gemmataceae bacterium]
MAIIRIKGGKIYDPTHGINGEVRDIWIKDGKIIAPPIEADILPEKVIDATGRIIMPGGVDMHCHIAGP